MSATAVSQAVIGRCAGFFADPALAMAEGLEQALCAPEGECVGVEMEAYLEMALLFTEVEQFLVTRDMAYYKTYVLSLRALGFNISAQEVIIAHEKGDAALWILLERFSWLEYWAGTSFGMQEVSETWCLAAFCKNIHSLEEQDLFS